MSDPETVRLLTRLLEQQARDSASRLESERKVLEEMGKVTVEVLRLNFAMESNEKACAARHSEIVKDFDRISRDVEDVEGDLEKSGEHNIAKLEKDLEKREADTKHWVRYVITALVGLCTGGFLLWVGRLLK